MFQEPEPIKYDNPIDIYAFGYPKPEKEIVFENLVPASEHTIKYRLSCAVDKCVNDIWENTPLCEHHAYDMRKKVEMSKELDHRNALEEYEQAKQEAEERYQEALYKQQRDEEALAAEWLRKFQEEERLFNSKHRPGMIYYLRVGENIKIGFSTYVEDRLRSYPPDSKLLAQHPGTPALEQTIHRKFFNHLSYGREWFTPCKEIDSHIQDVHHKFPKDNKNLIE